MCDEHDELLVMEEFADAFLGTVTRFGIDTPIACYDEDKILEILMADGMTHEDALEHFNFNIIGGWVGDLTPCFLRRCEAPKADRGRGDERPAPGTHEDPLPCS